MNPTGRPNPTVAAEVSVRVPITRPGFQSATHLPWYRRSHLCVVEPAASGDFDSPLDDPADVDGLICHDQIPGAPPAEEPDPARNDPDDDLLDEPDDSFWDGQPGPDDHPNEDGHFDGDFDAFNMKTWSFTPPPAPWYRTKPAVTAIIAASAAMAAIVGSGVRLCCRGTGS